MITDKPFDEITPPSIHFNPDFNPFKAEPKSSKEIPFLRNVGEKQSGIPNNWDTLYEIASAKEQRQSSFDLAHEKNIVLTDEKIETLSSRQVFQLHQRYIITQIKSGLMLVDQQAAHERILYERFLIQLDQNKGLSQQSLFPQTVTLNTTDFALANELLPDLHALGFQIRDFGKNTLVIEGVPADLPENNDLAAMLEELIEGFKNNHTILKLNKRENLARTLAKNSAIKAGTNLETEEMNDLIDQLFACSLPNVSIYGKKIIVKLSLEELIEKFNKH